MPPAEASTPSSPPPNEPRTFACPKCASRVSASAVTCPGCGIDLALVAALIERLALAAQPADPERPFVGDAMLSRFYTISNLNEEGVPRDEWRRELEETLGSAAL